VKTFSDNPLTNKGRSFKNCPNPRRRVNNLGVGAVVAGFVAPLVNGSVGDLAHIGLWFALGADLMAMAQMILGRLQ
jgi:hypothetical protein